MHTEVMNKNDTHLEHKLPNDRYNANTTEYIKKIT